MKITILTFSKEDNYGANLQCYALVKTLQSMGHEVEILDIQLPHPEVKFVSRLIRLPWHMRFEKFRNKFLPYFSAKYHTVEELKANPPKSDLYIVGSDQVWNPDITRKLDPLVYFLSFLDKDTPRIAYAASFGLKQWPNEELKPEVEDLLKRFNAISVREEEGKAICEKTFGVTASVVCDPTILPDNYDELCASSSNDIVKKEWMCFKFNRQYNIDVLLADKAKANGCTLFKMCDYHLSKGSKNRPWPSISAWLNQIKNSELIITDSFHCTVFCILFKKQFIVLQGFAKNNGRQRNLLEKLGLLSRFCPSNELKDRIDTLVKEQIDYAPVHEKLEVMREEGKEFISKALAFISK